MMKKDKNDQNINSIPKYLWGNYFKKPIKWLAHLINNYGNSKHPFITTGTSYAYAIGDEKRRHPELTELQIHEIVNSRIKQNRKKLGLPTDNNTTPSLAAAGLALGSVYYPWLAVPDIIFDIAASIDEPSTSNNIHTIADFPETVAKFTPSKIDDYVAKGVLTLGNIDDAVSTSGRNMFSNFDKKSGKINNTTDKTSVRESTNIKYRKQGGKMNILEFLKKGSGIHIKEKNRGKFTSYCGGKVTDECILKGKNSSNPAIRKRATFADNARHFKHQFGGLLGKTQEEVDIINNDNRNKAKGLFKGMLSGNILPTALNIGSMLNSAYNGWIEPETTYITGQAPSGGGSIKNPSKIVSSVSKLNNTGLPLTKKVNTNIKNTTTYLTGDNRYALSGLNKITRGLRERALYMITNHYADTLWNKDLVKYFKNREKAKARGANYRKFNLLINETLDDFIWNSGYFKEGGIIKVEDGTKLTFGLKINNWFKSDLGKTITSGVSLLYTGLQQNANLNKLYDLLQAWKNSYLNSILPESFAELVNLEEELLKRANPDYNSSPLVKLHKQYLLLTQALNKAKEKAGMDADQYIQLYMLAQQNNSSSGDIFSSMLKTFLG